jgi:hypothetical protein
MEGINKSGGFLYKRPAWFFGEKLVGGVLLILTSLKVPSPRKIQRPVLASFILAGFPSAVINLNPEYIIAKTTATEANGITIFSKIITSIPEIELAPPFKGFLIWKSIETFDGTVCSFEAPVELTTKGKKMKSKTVSIVGNFINK